MLDILNSLLSGRDTDLYVQIWQKRLKATNAGGIVIFDEAPLLAIQTLPNGKKKTVASGNAATGSPSEFIEITNPFLHPRTLLADFVSAEELIKYVYAKTTSGKLFKPSPRVIIHPMEKLEGGLTSIERRALHEMAEGAGASWVRVHEGPEIQIVEGQFIGYEAGNQSDNSIDHDGSSSWKRLKAWIFVIALAVWLALKITGNR